MTQQPQDPASPAAPASGPASGADPATTTSAPRTPDWSIDATADEKSTPRTAGADMTAAELAAAGRDFMPASPHDQPFTTSERKAYERKIMNFGLLLLVLVLAGTGIAAHALFTSLSERADSEWSLDLDTGNILPETPFSPLPSPAPVPVPKREPTQIELPDTPLPHGDQDMRRVIGRVTAIVDGQQGMQSALYARIEYYMPEAHANCFFHAPVAFGMYRAGDNVVVEYNAGAPDMCGTSQISGTQR